MRTQQLAPSLAPHSCKGLGDLALRIPRKVIVSHIIGINGNDQQRLVCTGNLQVAVTGRNGSTTSCDGDFGLDNKVDGGG